MSAREWKPGDVAMVRVFGQEHVAIRQVDGWANAFCTPYSNSHRMGDVDDVRPLVVIDPEDAEQVERLRRAILGPLATAHDLDDFAQALREFANPTPPKPDEPTGLGAVVEDGAGVKWIRSGAAFSDPNWQRCGGNEWTEWTDIDAVRILSEGVPS